MVEHDGITPETRVGRMLERWPELEEVLIGMAPEFQRLRNPVLRKTVAKVATLRQVAKVGGVPLGTLVTRLREAAGLSGGGAFEDETQATTRPAWASPERVVARLDARPIIEGGGHPLEEVMRGLTALEPGQCFELVTPFVPAPLIARAEARGFAAWTEPGEGRVRTLFGRAE